MNILRSHVLKRGRRRAEGGLYGYRSIITVIVLIGLVGVLAFTGVVRKGLCFIDAAACSDASRIRSSTSGLEPVSLPAPSEERIVRTVAGNNVVPPGRPSLVYGKKSAISPGAPPQLQRLWDGNEIDSNDAASVPSTTWKSSMFLPLSSLPCGVEISCDDASLAGKVSSDSKANQTKGISKFSLLGLDPLVGKEGISTVVDLNLPLEGKSGQPHELHDCNERSGLLYRNTRYLRDETSTETWTWQGRNDHDGGQQVVVVRGRGGQLVSVAFYKIHSESSGEFKRSSVRLSVSDNNRDAVEVWLDKFGIDGPDLPQQVFEPLSPISADGNMLVRIIHESGEVARETVKSVSDIKAITPEMMRDDPGLMRAGVSVTKETLGRSDSTGERTFSSSDSS